MSDKISFFEICIIYIGVWKFALNSREKRRYDVVSRFFARKMNMKGDRLYLNSYETLTITLRSFNVVSDDTLSS